MRSAKRSQHGCPASDAISSGLAPRGRVRHERSVDGELAADELDVRRQTLRVPLQCRLQCHLNLGRIVDALGAVVRVVDTESLPEAVQVAYGLASPGGTVLLAPACASLDMFRDYAKRGDAFTQAVARLEEEVCEKREQ